MGIKLRLKFGTFGVRAKAWVVESCVWDWVSKVKKN